MESPLPPPQQPALEAPPGRGRRFGALAPTLAAWGVTPDMVSWAGLAFALACGACLAAGAGHALPWASGSGETSWWPFVAGLWLGLSCLADLLDGDLARASSGESPGGALLDSSLDRIGDLAMYAGCALYFAARGHVTGVALACLAAAAAVLVSYVKARSEGLAEGLRCGGYWGRGERMVTLLCGCFLGVVPAALWMLALLPFLTVWRRVREGMAHLTGSPLPAGISWRRSSPVYLATCAGLVGLLVVLPLLHPLFRAGPDPLGALLR